MLKGKQAEAKLYAPEVGPHQSIDFATSTIDTAPDLVDRETQVAAMVDFISCFFSKSESVQQQQQQPQSGIMVIDGPVGIGKSSLLSYVHHKAIPSISGVRSLLLRALPNGAPFSLCSQVLQKLLELDGVVDPSTFSRLEVRPVLCCHVPLFVFCCMIIIPQHMKSRQKREHAPVLLLRSGGAGRF